MTAFSLLPEIAPTLSAGILNCVADGLALAAIGWICVKLFGVKDARTRFAVWFSTLVAILILPFLSSLRSAPPSNGFSPAHPLFTVSSLWAVGIFAAWLIFATAGMVRVARGFIKLRGLRKACRRVDIGSLDPALQNVIAKSDRAAKICISDELQVPTAVGFFEPVVILPSWTLRELSTAELKPILLHELAHLSRWDDWTNLFQKVVHALIFFHPIVWWIESRLSLEREMACDDIVLAKSGDARAYAQSLLTIAEKIFVRRGLSLAQAAVSHMRQTSLRVAQILDSKRPRVTIGGGLASAGFAVAVFSSLIALPKMPEVVGFRNNTPELTVSQVAQPMVRSQSARLTNSGSPKLSAHMARLVTSSRSQRPIRKAFETNTTETAIPAVMEASFFPPASENTKTEVGIRRTVYVVMQTQRSTNSNSSFVTIDVWRVTLYGTASSNDQGPLKKI